MDSRQHDDDAFGEFLLAHGPDVTPPSGFKEDLRQRLIAGLSEHQEAPVRHRLLLHPWFVRSIAAAAMVMLVAGVSWWLAWGGVETAGADFATVLRHIREAKWLEYDQVVRVPGAPETSIHVMMGQLGQSRTTYSDGRIIIEDKRSGRSLRLTPQDMTASAMSIPQYSAADDPVERLRKAGDGDGRLVGAAVVADRQVLVYELRQLDDLLRVFVDPGSELPVMIEVGDRQEASLVLENLVWNRPMSDSLFSMEVPDGYALDAPTEESLVYLLRTCATLGGGVFPSQLDAKAVVDLILAAGQDDSAHREFSVGGVELGEETREMLRECNRGLAFVEAVSKNGSWNYSGNAARLGDATRAVCCWQPPNGPTIRVVYGDLRILDIAQPDGLPEEVPTPANSSDEIQPHDQDQRDRP